MLRGNKYLAVVIVAVIANLAGCEKVVDLYQQGEQERKLRQLLHIPRHFSLPNIPEFNMPTKEKIRLGRHLFYDKRLSANNTQSCSSCHFQALAFSDAKATPIGSTGHKLVRNSPGLANVMYYASFTWANDGFVHIEDQLQVPIRADNPVELGVTDDHVGDVLARFDSDEFYQELFSEAFPDSDTGASINKIIFALASFSRTLISADSAYDRYLLGDREALSEQALQGFRLFHGERFECFHCHAGVNFSASYQDKRRRSDTIMFPFFNNGLYNIDGKGAYPEGDQGLYDLTLNRRHRGFFRPQSLRNIALTAPYMHDGSIATLRGVMEHYVQGGTIITEGPHAGDGRLNPLKSGFIRGIDATEEEINAVIAFLEALTDESFVTNPDYSDPFNQTPE